MTQFLAAFAVFIALHSVPANPRVRAALIAILGHGGYIAAYSAVSLMALAWLFFAAFTVDYVELWSPTEWQGWITFAAAPFGLFFVLAGLFSRNPFSATARHGGEEPGAIVAVTRHPVPWGFLFWAVGHIPPNGDLRSLLLFGGFALFTGGSIAMLEKRNAKKHGASWREMIAGTSITPFCARLERRTRCRIDRPMAAALVVSGLSLAWLLGGGHAWLFTGDPLLYLQSF